MDCDTGKSEQRKYHIEAVAKLTIEFEEFWVEGWCNRLIIRIMLLLRLMRTSVSIKMSQNYARMPPGMGVPMHPQLKFVSSDRKSNIMSRHIISRGWKDGNEATLTKVLVKKSTANGLAFGNS